LRLFEAAALATGGDKSLVAERVLSWQTALRSVGSVGVPRIGQGPTAIGVREAARCSPAWC
jgi:hypothetical protein